ncbi:MAG: hypothetical protein A3G34_08680 [Candidatus Lindowbacteria bacterium RIFCSPLOWO2_12_FULL_62_27]|nr:MAG: hypothetical protein A3G34_08680 [Candidatus Lindowbacteria bacterium RIFCSPLOWO2_12_FULL_62_27]
MFSLMKIVFWPVKEAGKFFLILFLLFRFTSLSDYVAPRTMTAGLVSVAKNGWNRCRYLVAESADYIRSASAAVGRSAGQSHEEPSKQ